MTNAESGNESLPRERIDDLSQTLAVATDPSAQRDLTQLARTTGEVQKTAMAMRMVPIGQLFQRTNRQVRDLSRKVGKQGPIRRKRGRATWPAETRVKLERASKENRSPPSQLLQL